MKKLILILIVVLMTFNIVYAQECLDPDHIQIYFFYSETCSHCAKLKPMLEEIDDKCEFSDVNSYSVTKFRDKWVEFSNKFNTTTGGVPMLFVGDKVFIGYTPANGSLEYDPVSNGYIGYKNQIIDAIQQNIDKDKCDIHALLNNEKTKKFNPIYIFLLLLLYPLSYLFLKDKLKNPEHRRYWYAGFFAILIICLFVFVMLSSDTIIKEFAVKLPFPLFVFVIAFADGFNPCAFTVMIILLSLLTYTKSRRDMFFIGTTFIITSAIMYFIFILTMIIIGSWAIEKYGTFILLVLGIIITIAGIINLKDFFFFKKIVSLSISDKQKSKITKQAGKIVKTLQESKLNKRIFFLTLGSTILLAVFVNLVELGCTALLPIIYMASLINTFGKEIATPHIIWTLFYSVIYIIPLFAILLNFIYTFKSTRLSEKQGRMLKFVAGLFMLFFGMIMIFNPDILMFT